MTNSQHFNRPGLLGLALIALPGLALAQTSGETAINLPPVTVQGVVPASETEGYHAPRSSSATKTDTPLIDVPQTVVAMPKQLLEDTGATNVEKALDYVGGITKGNNFGGLNLYEMNLRGLKTTNSAKNGFTTGRRYDATSDAANIEQVDVLLGPSASLYGRGDPGGFVNIVTKKPLTENFTILQGSIGSYGLYRSTVDANAIMSDDKSLLGRANVAVESRDSFRDHVSSDRQFFAPVLTWQPNGNNRLTIEAEAINDERVFDRGVVAVNGKLGVIPISRFLGEPSDGKIENRNYMASARLEHEISNDWTLRAAMQAKNGSMYGYATEPNTLNATTGVLTRRRALRDYTWHSATTQFEAVGNLETGGIGHTLLAGLEYERATSSELFTRANVNSINIYNPVYSPSSATLSPISDLKDTSDNYALYLQDQISLTDKLEAQLGFRADWYEQDFANRVSGKSVPQSRQGFSPRAGLTYKVVPDVALYTSVAKSFRPVMDSHTGFTTAAGDQPFEPETGLGYEAGVKTELLDKRLNATASVFHLTKKNVLATNPADTNTYIQTGEVRSKGFDLNLTANLLPEWRVVAGYAYIDAEVTKDTTIAVGTRLQNIPMHSIGLWSVYEFLHGPMKGFGFGGGVNAVGDRAGSSSNDGFMLPSYAKVDLLGFYRITEAAKLSFNITNLFDTEYYERALGPLRVVPGEPLSAMASLSIKF
ncbi:TonB-dependent siderophore receptor [Ferrovibrio sp.]|uniref:TonB-dependent siderophore receptor n=1 Tax=Ferrovibrio sp. TaxID=1917215 RepID=UPI0035AE2871